MITKEQLIKFIEKNFDELQCGGTANYEDMQGISLKDFKFIEKSLLKLAMRR